MVPCLNVQCYVRSYCYGLNKLFPNYLIHLCLVLSNCIYITLQYFATFVSNLNLCITLIH